eukprot:TRINITY_DN5113_c0_g1_i1.p1 TRINITY_DN5113_c0_g1~~TRINITY_DN5113_c0_g1_i1.p1  ORF type:complete len:242 (-),score=32.64 TRINITY_DN5113_c0_g1_i1:80-805(-)
MLQDLDKGINRLKDMVTNLSSMPSDLHSLKDEVEQLANISRRSLRDGHAQLRVQRSESLKGSIALEGYGLVEEWLSSYRPPRFGQSHVVDYSFRAPIDLRLLAASVQGFALQNAHHRARMLQVVESGELMKEAYRLFRECDHNGSGALTWNNGETKEFITKVLNNYSMFVPSESQIYEIYKTFDADGSHSLDARECICLADTIVRAIFLELNTKSSIGRLWARRRVAQQLQTAAFRTESCG